MNEPWKYAFASVVGTSHGELGTPCQDSSACSVLKDSNNQSILVAVVSDGAGSAMRSELGSALACKLFTSEMETYFESGGLLRGLNRDFAQDWLIHFQNEIKSRAESDNTSPADFACTVLACVVGDNCAAFMQVGDGCIIVSPFAEPDQYEWVFWPQKGEFANVTTFATSETAIQSLEFSLVEGTLAELALLTDGIERLALRFDTQEAHAPFFLPMFVPLRSKSSGYIDPLSLSLREFLNSQRINDRTDDDKTLILATRRIAALAVRPPEETNASEKGSTTP